MDSKKCSRCKEIKPIGDFYIGKIDRLAGKPYWYCKSCCYMLTKKWNKSRELSWRDKDLRRTFGIGEKEYNEILAAQNFVCAICFRSETSKRGDRVKNLAVDHCHTTGKIRGLLCCNCNTAIGSFQENIQSLQSAIQYLQQQQPPPPQ